MVRQSNETFINLFITLNGLTNSLNKYIENAVPRKTAQIEANCGKASYNVPSYI
jgi:hypothetical protein